jgi:hypothetical protein
MFRSTKTPAQKRERTLRLKQKHATWAQLPTARVIVDDRWRKVYEGGREVLNCKTELGRQAVQLKFADGKGTGLWYCGKCREIQYGVTRGLDLKGIRMGRNGKPCSESHKEQAEECCTNQQRRVTCTGCRMHLDACKCERKNKNICVSCGAKLMFDEGRKIRWGSEIREVCYKCSKDKRLSAMLVDAGK